MIAFNPQKGVVNHAKRIEMERLIRSSTSLDVIAAKLGYASGRSALVMASRWGLHTLRKESYLNPLRRKK